MYMLFCQLIKHLEIRNSDDNINLFFLHHKNHTRYIYTSTSQPAT